jgi:hypothetical protein
MDLWLFRLRAIEEVGDRIKEKFQISDLRFQIEKPK